MAKFNQDGGGGGVSAPAAPAPAASPSSTSTPAAQGPGAGPASASPPAGAPPAQDSPVASPTPAPAPAAGGKLIDTLPARGSAEYWEKYGELTPDQQRQAESEWYARESGQDAPPPDPAKVDDPAAAPLPGDKPKPEEDVFITSDDLSKLDPKVQQVVNTMQARIDEFAPFADEKFGKGIQMFLEDPIIKQRMEEMSSGNPWSPGALAAGFKAEAYLTPETVQALDFIGDPEGSSAKLGALLQKAHEDGLKNGSTSAQYEMQQKVAFAERKATFEKGFNDLVSAHPELKPKESDVTDMRDPRHPLKPVLKWAKDNLGDRYFMNPENKQPFKSAYAAFLAANGQLDGAIKNTVNNERNKFIRNLNVAQSTAATVGRDTPSAQPNRQSPVPNLDVDRYNSDPRYRQDFFNSADHATRLKLEQVSYGNKVN